MIVAVPVAVGPMAFVMVVRVVITVVVGRIVTLVAVARLVYVGMVVRVMVLLHISTIRHMRMCA